MIKTVEKEVPIEDEDEPSKEAPVKEEPSDEEAKKFDGEDEAETADEEDEAEDKEDSTDSKDNEENEDEAEKPKTKIVTVEVEETVYEEVTETVKEETVVGTYHDFKVCQLYYNTGNDTLLLIGNYTKYSSSKSLNDKDADKNVIYEIAGKRAEPYSEKLDTYCGIIGNFDDGRLIANYYYDQMNMEAAEYFRTYECFIIDCDDFSVTRIDYCSSESSAIAVNKGKNLYCIYSKGSTAYQAKYSFAKGEWEGINNANADYFGAKDGYFYYWDLSSGKIAKSDLEGNISYIKGIDTINDIEVKDFNNMPNYNNNGGKLYITDDKSFVFYDRVAGAFRIIKKQ